MAYITGDQVRARLRTLTELEVSDELLSTVSFLPAGDAWLDMVLAAAGLSFTGLAAAEQALALAAEVAFVAHKVVSDAPVRGSKSGPIEIRPIPAGDKLQICEQLRQEWSGYLRLLGCCENESWWSHSFGGSSYDRT